MTNTSLSKIWKMKLQSFPYIIKHNVVSCYSQSSLADVQKYLSSSCEKFELWVQ